MTNAIRRFKGKRITDKDVKNQYPDRSCRNNHRCPICTNDRTYSSKHREAPMLNQELQFKIDTYSGLHDPWIDKVRGELLTSWKDRFEQSDRA